MLCFLVIVLILIVILIIIYMVHKEFKLSEERIEISKGYEKYSWDNFNTFEDLVHSDRYTFHKLDVLMDNFENIVEEK